MGYDVGQYVIDELSNKITEELKTAERLDYLSKRKECVVSPLLDEKVKSLRDGGVWLVSDDRGNIVGYKISHVSEIDNSQTFSELFEIKNDNDKVVDLNSSVVSIGENLTISFSEKNLERTFCVPVVFTQEAILKGGDEIKIVWDGVLAGTKTIYADINREIVVNINDLIKGNIYTMVFVYEGGSYTVVLVGQSVKNATSEKAGIVKPDNDTIKVSDQGELSVKYAFYTREDLEDPLGESQRICPLPHASSKEDYAGGGSTTKWGHVRIHEEAEVQNDEEVVDIPEQNISYVPSYKEFFKTKERAWKNKKENQENKKEIENVKKSIQNNLLVNSNFKLTPDGDIVSKSGNFNYFEIECPEEGEIIFEDNKMTLKQNASSYKISQFTTLPQKEPFVLGVSFESTNVLTKNDVDIIIYNEEETITLLDTTLTSEENEEKILYVNEEENVDGLKRFSISTPYTNELSRCKIEFIFRCSADTSIKYLKAELGYPSDYYNESLDNVARKASIFESTSACKNHGVKQNGNNILFNPCFEVNTLNFNTALAECTTVNGMGRYLYRSNAFYPVCFDGWFIGQGSSIGYSGNVVDTRQTVVVDFNASNQPRGSYWLRQYIYDCKNLYQNKKITFSIKYRTNSNNVFLRAGVVKNDRSIKYIGEIENNTIVESRVQLKSSDYTISSVTVKVPSDFVFEDLVVEVGVPAANARDQIEIVWIKAEEGEKATELVYTKNDLIAEKNSNRVYLMTEKKTENFNIADQNTWYKMSFYFPKRYPFVPIFRIYHGYSDNLYYSDATSSRSGNYIFKAFLSRLELSYKGGNSSIQSYLKKGLDVGCGHCLKGFDKKSWTDEYFETDPDGAVIGREADRKTLFFTAIIFEEKKITPGDPYIVKKTGWYCIGSYYKKAIETSNNRDNEFLLGMQMGDIETPSTASTKSWLFSCEAGKTVYGKVTGETRYSMRAAWVGIKLSTVGKGVIRFITDDGGDDDIVRQELPLIQDTEWHAYVFDKPYIGETDHGFSPIRVKIEIEAETKVEGNLCGSEFLN